jgi:1-acyl-sn-glycerol-3-phosphate acyltransferase
MAKQQATAHGDGETAAARIAPVYWLGRGMFRCLFKYYFGWEVFNAERVPLSGAVILASNHESFVDPGAIGGALEREAYYLARESSFIPVLGTIMRKVNAIPVNQEGGAMAGLRAGLEVLEGGNALILFPEGARTEDGAMQPFRSGVGLIAGRSAAPVVPVRVFGLHEAYGRHMKFPRPAHKVIVKFGRPLRFDAELDELREGSITKPKVVYQKISQAIEDAVARLTPDAES